MATRSGGEIARVDEGSISHELGLRQGDIIVSVNGKPLRDELDFRFYTAEEEVTIEVRRTNGDVDIFDIEKDEDEHLGITFVDPIFDGIKTCVNNCLFCFIRQIPATMRGPLHVRDDDYRMSFLYGNFVTLTNLTEEDYRRLEEQRLSPLRVSVHSTVPELRVHLMRNPKAAGIMSQLLRLSDMGIRLHAQIVVMRGVNDGEALRRTLTDLDSLGPNMESVGVVPAVYTKYRQVKPSPPIDRDWACEILDLIEDYARSSLDMRGDHWVYGADELYILSGREFPPYEYYGDFHQYENGIGIVPEFRRACRELAESIESGSGHPFSSHGDRILAVTGRMAQAEVQWAIRLLNLETEIEVLTVDNRFFGDTVTVSGLLTGQDIIDAVLKRSRGSERHWKAILIPSVATFNGLFLDDVTPEDVESICSIPVRVVHPAPLSLLKAVRQ